MSADGNHELRDTIDLSGVNSVAVLLAHKAKLKDAYEKIIAQQKQVDDRLKEAIGDYRFFKCGDVTGSYAFEPRGEYTVRASNPRVLRISK